MGYQEVMGFGLRSPAYLLGNMENVGLWESMGYQELWVKMALTVHYKHRVNVAAIISAAVFKPS